MIQLRHTGLYVKNLETETKFYKEVFGMHSVCEHLKQADVLIDDLLRHAGASILATKLLTEQGRQSGVDDMLELLQVLIPQSFVNQEVVPEIYRPGCMHLGFGVDDIDDVVSKIIKNGGTKYTDIHMMNNGNKCCFCQDPEGNWLELIQRQ